jgi:hypothetical protein
MSSDTNECGYAIALSGESPLSAPSFYERKKGSLTIRSLESGQDVLTLQWDGSSLQILSPCTWMSKSEAVWRGGFQGPLVLQSPYTLEGLRRIE